MSGPRPRITPLRLLDEALNGQLVQGWDLIPRLERAALKIWDAALDEAALEIEAMPVLPVEDAKAEHAGAIRALKGRGP